MKANKNVITLSDGRMVFTSYGTVIGFSEDKYAVPVFTDEYFSVTTSKHRNAFIRQNNGKIIPEGEYGTRRKAAGL